MKKKQYHYYIAWHGQSFWGLRKDSGTANIYRKAPIKTEEDIRNVASRIKELTGVGELCVDNWILM
jgi:hypothetical protein